MQSFFSAFPAHFERLNLGYCGGVDDEVATCLAAAPSCHSLRSLVLNGAYITDSGVRALATAPWLACVAELSLHDCREIQDPEALGFLCAGLRAIASLSLARLRATALTSAVLQQLCFESGDGSSVVSTQPASLARHKTKLRKLRLDHSRGVDDQAVFWLASSLGFLHELSIRGCVLVGPLGLAALSGGVQSLRRLHIGGKLLGKEAIEHFRSERPEVMLIA